MSNTGRIRARDGGLIALAVAGVVAISVASHADRIVSNPVTKSQVGEPRPPKARQQVSKDLGESGHPSHWHLSLHFPNGLFHLLGLLALAGLVLGVIAVVIAVVPKLGIRQRLARQDDPVVYAPADGRLGHEVSATFDKALAGLRRGDREQAIIDCWLRLERLAETAGHPARASQTSSELVSWWLGALPLPEQPLHELAELYREARFSSHRMPAESVEAARQAVQQLRSALMQDWPRTSDV